MNFWNRCFCYARVLGIDVFQRAAGAIPSSRLLYSKAKGLTASGYEVDEGFVVRSGSQSLKDSAPALPAPIGKIRQNLLAQGVLTEDANGYRTTQDYTFSSPSLAAAVMLARSANGRIQWKDEKGRPLREIQEQGS